jgi:hypothetical protein
MSALGRNDDILAVALHYAADYGWPVFPLHTVRDGKCSCGNAKCGRRSGKHPRTAHGLTDATTDPETIRSWWAKWPDANIGIPTGAASGFWVLDVDGIAGSESLQRLCKEQGSQIEDTRHSRSGGGGSHLYFQYPGFEVESSNGRLARGIDVKGDGGCIVAPPSVHLSAGRYEWIDESAPISPAPTWLLELVRRAPETRHHRGGTTSVDIIPEGSRNATLASQAGAMRRRGMDASAITAALLAENSAHCQPPLEEQEVHSIAGSVSQYLPADALDAPDASSAAQSDSQTDQLLELGADAELFHTPDEETYATVNVNGHTETWRVADQGFRDWITHRYFRATGKAPNSQALQSALGVFRCRARFEGNEQPVFVRVAGNDSTIYIDLANNGWEMVEVTASGWRVITEAPVKFRRTRGMMPLPRPVSGGSLEDLYDFLNFEDASSLKLMAAWLIACFRPRGPYPVLLFHGEHGSTKSTTCRILRRLIDPNRADLRAEPREPRDLVIAAQNQWVVALDNVSYLPPWLSDGLCRLSTGSGYATRQLYSDDEERIFQVQRPIMANGISEIATRSDLLDRSLIEYLPSILEESRRPEEDFWRDFDLARPGILGALLDVVASAMDNLPHVHLPRTPRMADFAIWATAAEEGFGWKPGSFMDAYTSNRANANELALDASPLTPWIRQLAPDSGEWEGTATALVEELAKRAGDGAGKAGWPKNGRALSAQLRRLAPNFRVSGIDLQFGSSGSRFIRVRKVAPFASAASNLPSYQGE